MPEATAMRRDLPVLAAVAAGGVLGALARYGVSSAWPHEPGGFPWATFGINVSGCLAIGVLLVMITELRSTHRLTRPFLGTGVLGGYTTFSTYAVETERLLSDHPVTALVYLVGTAAAALVAVQAGVVLTRALGRRS
ncbi:MAG TPA: fluoride efflux transporter CrcB [Kribbellaceae bacterium]|nr:fluoride efflux transporter CrcB [Kribbellaceae bacterium]